jgi:hypothetical protein
MNLFTRCVVYTLMGAAMLSITPQAHALPKDEGANNLGGSTYFSWKIKNPISGLDNAPKVIGYACLTRDTIGGMARNAYAYRYAIKARPKSEKWWLEYQEGIVIRPRDNSVNAYNSNSSSYIGSKTASGVSSIPQLQKDVTNPETGWFQRDFEADVLGLACIDGGISSSVKHLEQTHNLNITIENGKRR